MTPSASPASLAARRRRQHGVAVDFDGARLSLARRLARLPRTELARDIGLSPAAITQFERGMSHPTAPIAAALALRLGVPEVFFQYGHIGPGLTGSAAHFRSLRATPALSRDQALAFAELGMDVVAAVEQYVDLPVLDLPDVGEAGPDIARPQIAAAAARVRTAWGMPTGPVGHVVRLLEAHGVVVLVLPDRVGGRDLDPGVDAFSTATAGRPVVLLSRGKNDKARSRFDAAHELGHLLLHQDADPGNKIIEGQAQTFAAEFLMPADQVAADLPSRLDWDRLHAAKRRWGTSLRALVYRARTLGVMSETVARRANIALAQHGNPEAGPLGPPERPTLLGNAADLLAGNHVELEDLAAAARLPLPQVTDVINAGSDPRPRVSFTE
jgi:Zn-dependent peptidase ImmA (M78 family)/transcriptional regulator with XRE-family HTH domain